MATTKLGKKTSVNAAANGPLRALPFVIDNNGILEVNPGVTEFLESVSPPFAVVCVAGPYRSGKSCLLNRGILKVQGDRQGFSVGSSVNACTKGLHLYNGIVNCGGKRLLVIDSEGTRSLTQSAGADSKLIALSLLLASVFVYNSMGTIDESALSALGVFASVAKAVAGDDPNAFDPPELLWVLRDFHLEVQTEEGRKLTPTEFLDHVLSSGENELRDTLRKQFPSRELFPFVRPVEKECDLVNLSKLQERSLRPEFIQQLEKFRGLLADKGKTKMLGSEALSGSIFLKIAQHHCARINEGHAPSVKDAYAFMLENELLRLNSEYDQLVVAQWDALVSRLPLPPSKVASLLGDELLPLMASEGINRGISLEARTKAEGIQKKKLEDARLKLIKKNEEVGTIWIRQEFKNCEKADDVVGWFRAYLANCVDKIGETRTIETLNLFVESVMSSLQDRSRETSLTAERQVRELEEIEQKLARVHRERDDLQAALEKELACIRPPSVEKEVYEELERDIKEKEKRLAFVEAELADMRKGNDEAERSKKNAKLEKDEDHSFGSNGDCRRGR